MNTPLILPECGLTNWPRLGEFARAGVTVLCHEEDRSAVADRFPECRAVAYGGGSLTPSRTDLFDLAQGLAPAREAVLAHDETCGHGWEAYATALGLMGFSRVRLARQSGDVEVSPSSRPERGGVESLLLVASGGIGNLVQATPLLEASLAAGWRTTFCPVADKSGPSVAPLFRGALDGLEVIGPDGLDGADADVRLNIEARSYMVPGEFFHSPYREPVTRHEAEAYAQFFRNVTGVAADPGRTAVGGFDEAVDPALRGRVVLCPGSKPGWDSKRWPHFTALAGLLARQGDEPVILCREPDLDAYDRHEFLHSLRQDGRIAGTLVTDATLPQAAAILRAARGVIANDCGPAHVAAATGTPTLVLFGPSSLKKNRPLAPNARSLSLGLDCQPCQGKAAGPGRLGPGEFSCEFGYPCLGDLSAERVLAEAQTLFNANEVCA